MYLTCVRSGEDLALDEHDVDYLQELMNRIDVEGEVPHFLSFDLTSSECLTLSWLLESHIEENKIFEVVVGDKRKPIIVDDNISKPTSYEALSLDRLSFLSNVKNFLSNSKRGITISN